MLSRTEKQKSLPGGMKFRQGREGGGVGDLGRHRALHFLPLGQIGGKERTSVKEKLLLLESLLCFVREVEFRER